MSLYVLYHQKTNPERLGIYQTVRKRFEDIYEKYKIDMVGFWSVEGNVSENYLLYKYDSEEDYKTKAGLLQNDSDYLALREEVQETRLSIEEIRLVPVWEPE
jgi:hypothetical protein